MEKGNVYGRNESLALNSHTFEKIEQADYTNAMTIRGAVNKTTILLAIVTISAAGSWLLLYNQPGIGGYGWVTLALIGAVVVAGITCAKMQTAPYTAPLYAFLEGSVLGVISAFFESEYPGIVINAVLLTFGTLFGLLLVYRVSGFHVTARFRAGVVSCTLAIFLVYGIDVFLQLFGVAGLKFIHQSGLIGIGFSLYVVAIAALNLVLDFDLIENGARRRSPKYMEWYSAFGLMVTLIWLYLELLRLLALLASSSDDN